MRDIKNTLTFFEIIYVLLHPIAFDKLKLFMVYKIMYAYNV